MKVKGHFRNWLLIAVALLVMFGLAACLGIGDLADGGIGGSGKSYGPIIAFGSIFVNGVEFETGAADIIIDGSPSLDTNLKLGMVVMVTGEFNVNGTTGTAVTVSYDDLVEGPMTSAVNTTEKRFGVMYQDVFYTTSTIFENDEDLQLGALTPSDLSVDNVLEISGLFDSAGRIRATRVEREALTYIPGPDEVLEVHGLVANLDTTLQTFDIGLLAISYSAVATSFDEGTIDDLANGVLVEVKGDDDPADGLEADRIEFEFEDFGNEGDLLEFEGYVTDINPAVGDFEVDGLPVVTDGQTLWTGGYTGLSDVTMDDRVEVEGTLQDQGGTQVLVAREVELEIEDSVSIEAPLQAIDTTANMLSILGFGVAYSDTTSITDFEDNEDINPNTAVDELEAGDWLQIDAVLDDNGDLFATSVQQDNDNADLSNIVLKGPAANITILPSFSFFIQGVEIVPVSGVEYKVEDIPISETIFYNNLAEGTIVKAKGSFLSGVLTATQLSLED